MHSSILRLRRSSATAASWVLLLFAVLAVIPAGANNRWGAGSSPFLSSLHKRKHSFLLKPQSSHLEHQHQPLQFTLDFPRGGAAASDDDDEESEESDYSEEEEEDSDLEDAVDVDFDAAEEDFAEANHVQRALADWSKTPPLTKAYLSASIFWTLFGFLLNGNEFPSWLLLDWNKVLKRGQVWRLLTAFLNFGPFGVGYAMTCHFLWTYMWQLERLNHDKPYDFWMLMVFGQLLMAIGFPLMKLSPTLLGHNLSTYLVYIWSRYYEGSPVSVFGLFIIKAELLPWLFLAQTFLLEGEVPILDLLGIAFGHVYHHLKTIGALRAPPFLVAWYKGDSPLAKQLHARYEEITADFELLA